MTRRAYWFCRPSSSEFVLIPCASPFTPRTLMIGTQGHLHADGAVQSMVWTHGCQALSKLTFNIMTQVRHMSLLHPLPSVLLFARHCACRNIRARQTHVQSRCGSSSTQVFYTSRTTHLTRLLHRPFLAVSFHLFVSMFASLRL